MGETFPMTGGDGDHSYAKNSKYQKLASESVKEMIQEAVMENLDTQSMSSRGAVAIADLGCSVGPNTFFTVQNLIQAVQKKWFSNNLEFQVFFNDHSANDFNTLFASLPTAPGRQYYHAAAVAGSFHGRLFPRNSITVAHSSYALQWLSQQPQGARNEGRIHYSGASEDVLRAYSDQYEKDLGVFMSARAEEIVSGGILILVVPGTPDGVPESDLPAGVLFNYFGYSLMDLANEGVVDKAKIDAFNLPIYAPTIGEMRKVIEKNGCFSIKRMELTDPRSKLDGPIDVAHLILHMRAGLEGIFAAHFGDSVVDKMFAKVSQRAQEMSHFFESGYNRSSQLFVVLSRK